ncbi:hypothetical protein, partial [Klebsiella pneumoniae]|uniref:hypothetical protein n=1 Tax=Klebsiella pneumoniae TaxID=573 RepID=UPI002730CA95
EGTNSDGGESDCGIEGGSAQFSWHASVGQNINLGGGIQTIGAVRIGFLNLKIEINCCRDFIVKTLARKLNKN